MTNIIKFPKNDFTDSVEEIFNEVLGQWNIINDKYVGFLIAHSMWSKEFISAEIRERNAESVFERMEAHKRMIYIVRQKKILFEDYSAKTEKRLKDIEKELNKIKNQKVDILT